MFNVIKKIRNIYGFQFPSSKIYLKKVIKDKKIYGIVRREEGKDYIASGICYAFCSIGLKIQGTKISNMSFKTN